MMKSLSKVANTRLIIVLLAVALVAFACGSSTDTSSGETDSADAAGEETSEAEVAVEEEADTDSDPRIFRIGAIPDQEPERLQRTYDLLADYLEAEIDDLEVEYTPVTEYSSAVTGFEVGDFDAVWFGGLTGVQARLEVEGSEAILQRDIDESFTSVFIARADAGIDTLSTVEDLSVVAGRSFTFGSESSTSGRLMPQSFLDSAGVDVNSDLAGEPGFSGSHDATIEVVSAGSFEVGALNSQVWDARVAEGTVDTTEVVEIFRTPAYFDYHWVAQPELDDRFGTGFTNDLTEAFLGLDNNNAEHQEILDLFGAGAFIVTDNANYEAIELVGRDSGLIR